MCMYLACALCICTRMFIVIIQYVHMYTHVHGRCMYCCCAVCVCMYVRSLSLGNPVLMLCSSSIPFTVSSLILHSFQCVFSHLPFLSMCLLSSSIPFTVSSLILHSFHCVFYPPPTLHCVFSHPPFLSMCLLPCYVYATRLCCTCFASREGVGADHHSLSFRSHGGRNHLEDNKG